MPKSKLSQPGENQIKMWELWKDKVKDSKERILLNLIFEIREEGVYLPSRCSIVVSIPACHAGDPVRSPATANYYFCISGPSKIFARN